MKEAGKRKQEDANKESKEPKKECDLEQKPDKRADKYIKKDATQTSSGQVSRISKQAEKGRADGNADKSLKVEGSRDGIGVRSLVRKTETKVKVEVIDDEPEEGQLDDDDDEDEQMEGSGEKPHANDDVHMAQI